MNLYVKASMAYADHKSAANAYLKNEQSSNIEPKEEPQRASLYPNDTVMISQAAKIAANAKKTLSGMYSKFFPTREGEEANALAEAVMSPSTQSFSKGKTLGQAAKEARAELDAQYEVMNNSGEPYDINSFEGKDSNSLFKNLDRRALYTVKSNEGGLFSEEEQGLAQSLMVQQEGLAMGYYTGPTSLEGSYKDPYAGNDSARAKAYMEYLSSVSPDEKSSADWMSSMAASQNLYKWYKEHENKDGEEEDEISLLKVLLKLDADKIKTLKEKNQNIDETSSNSQN